MVDLNKTFDQSILRPEEISAENIKNVVSQALKLGFRAVVVHPSNIELVKSLLANSSVLTVSVCDFPHGRGLTKSRVKDVKEILSLVWMKLMWFQIISICMKGILEILRKI